MQIYILKWNSSIPECEEIKKYFGQGSMWYRLFLDNPCGVYNLAKTIGNKECQEVEFVLLGLHDHHFPWEKIKADASFDGMYGDVTFAVLE